MWVMLRVSADMDIGQQQQQQQQQHHRQTQGSLLDPPPINMRLSADGLPFVRSKPEQSITYDTWDNSFRLPRKEAPVSKNWHPVIEFEQPRPGMRRYKGGTTTPPAPTRWVSKSKKKKGGASGNRGA